MPCKQFFRTITEKILDYVVREMLHVGAGANDQQFRRTPKLPGNTCGVAFYSTQDADSEGEEGKFFVWTGGEIRRALADRAEPFMAAYGVKPGGNWEGKSILEFVGDLDKRPALTEARRRLFETRRNAYTLAETTCSWRDCATCQAILPTLSAVLPRS